MNFDGSLYFIKNLLLEIIIIIEYNYNYDYFKCGDMDEN